MVVHRTFLSPERRCRLEERAVHQAAAPPSVCSAGRHAGHYGTRGSSCFTLRHASRHGQRKWHERSNPHGYPCCSHQERGLCHCHSVQHMPRQWVGGSARTPGHRGVEASNQEQADLGPVPKPSPGAGGPWPVRAGSTDVHGTATNPAAVGRVSGFGATQARSTVQANGLGGEGGRGAQGWERQKVCATYPRHPGRARSPVWGTALRKASKQPTGPALGCAHGDKRRGYRWDVSDLWRSGLRAAADRTGGVDVLPLRGPIRGPARNTPATSAPGGSTARWPGAHRRRRARDRSGRNPPAPGRAQPSSDVTRKRAAVSGGRPGSVTVLIAPGSARRGPGTACARWRCSRVD